MNSASATVEFRSVTAGYTPQTPVLHEVSARIGPGLTLVTGPNGSGKSTLIEVAAGNLAPVSGQCLVLGSDANTDSTRRLRTYCPHQNGLIPGLSAYEHLLLAGLLDPPYGTRVEKYIAEWKLGEWLHHQVSELSTGNQRKAWLILCLADLRQVVLLDEPFNGLDPESAETLVGLLASLIDEGRTIVLVAHTPPEGIHSLVTTHLRVTEGRILPA